MVVKIMLDPTPASPELVQERLAICRACPNKEIYTVPFLKRDVERCSKCTCPLMTRTYFKSSVCGDKENPKW